MAFLGNTGYHSQKDYGTFPRKWVICYYNQRIKRSLCNYSNSLRSTRTIWEKLQISLALWSLPYTFFFPQKYHDCKIFMTWHRNLKSVASCNLFTLFVGWPYPDISWPEINSFSFICKFYFQFQLICYFCSEHWLALPNERQRSRRQRLESTEIEHRPIVSTYKLLKFF